ncbi:MAG: hypothetical protein GWN07_33995, partial [Actinobacteria bacterium]|nr:hypothetical protein [Actinomycetota bacterium]NIS36161.1 hypothetical protein [Actinomycetota bacterium]NIU70733.1 hypothetical protein [Actinomycetota bacterium]NIW32638.1 hypothetical protein [Actinomycetota bacterium]NIX24549.1 hypothetical protein [Actinomycetota bacterium]
DWPAGSAPPDDLFDGAGRARGALVDLDGDGWNDWVTAVRVDGANVVATWRGGADGWRRSSELDLPGPLFAGVGSEAVAI